MQLSMGKVTPLGSPNWWYILKIDSLVERTMADSKRPQAPESDAPGALHGNFATHRRSQARQESPGSEQSPEPRDAKAEWENAVARLHGAENGALAHHESSPPIKASVAPLSNLSSPRFQVGPRRPQSGCILRGVVPHASSDASSLETEAAVDNVRPLGVSPRGTTRKRPPQKD